LALADAEMRALGSFPWAAVVGRRDLAGSTWGQFASVAVRAAWGKGRLLLVSIG
jgi:hypothetical protein